LTFKILVLKQKYDCTKFINSFKSRSYIEKDAEVDFVIRSGSKVIPIDIKYTDSQRLQVERSLRNFINQYKPDTAFVVTRGFQDSIQIDETKVFFIPFWKLLSPDFTPGNFSRDWTSPF